jgi:hypothetical protein
MEAFLNQLLSSHCVPQTLPNWLSYTLQCVSFIAVVNTAAVTVRLQLFTWYVQSNVGCHPFNVLVLMTFQSVHVILTGVALGSFVAILRTPSIK